MGKHLVRIARGQEGQALIIVLALLALGGLTIAVNLNYATTSLKGAATSAENARGTYAAASGVEYALWTLSHGLPNPTTTPANVDGMAVSIQTVGGQSLTLYLDDLVLGVHSDWYTVSNNITLVAGNTYDYTITVTTSANATNNKKLSEFGALLPPGYSYLDDSATTWHATNLSTQGNPQLDNPNRTGTDYSGSIWVKWYWDNQGPALTTSSIYTEKFQISGTGNLWGSYAWMVGQTSDIGTVGQVTGVLTTVTSTATRPQDGRVMSKITAEAIVGSGGVYLFSWKETN